MIMLVQRHEAKRRNPAEREQSRQYQRDDAPRRARYGAGESQLSVVTRCLMTSLVRGTAPLHRRSGVTVAGRSGDPVAVLAGGPSDTGLLVWSRPQRASTRCTAGRAGAHG